MASPVAGGTAGAYDVAPRRWRGARDRDVLDDHAISFIADAKKFALDDAAPVHPARVKSADRGDVYRRDRRVRSGGGSKEDRMIWALLAAYLGKRPAWVQAIVFGLCVGAFIATAAKANERNPLISSVVLLVLVAGAVAGTAFYLALRARQRHGWKAGAPAPVWVNVAYTAVWVLSLLAAVRALFGDGGLKVAALAIVPIVLLAPPALGWVLALLRRPRTPEVGAPPPKAP
jgi:hypothetical protein